MHNYEFGPLGGSPYQSAGDPEKDRPRRHSTFSLIVTIVVVAAIAILGLSVSFWVLGLVFHLAGWILRVAILAAVAALVWRWVNRRRSPDSR
jgi:putative flippase GtrA